MLQNVILLRTELTRVRRQVHGIELADELLHASALGDGGETGADGFVGDLEERKAVGGAVGGAERAARQRPVLEVAAGHRFVLEAAAAGAMRGCLNCPIRRAGDAGVDWGEAGRVTFDGVIDDVVVVSVALLHVLLNPTLAHLLCRLYSMLIDCHASFQAHARKPRRTLIHLLVKSQGRGLTSRLGRLFFGREVANEIGVEALVAELDGVVDRIVGVWDGRHGDNAADVAANGGVDADV